MRTTPSLAALLLLAAGCTFLNDPSDLEPSADTAPPSAPAGLVAAAGVGQVSLQWNAVVVDDLDHYSVQVGTESGALTEFDTTASTTFTVTPLVNETQYFFAVAAVDRAGNVSDFSNEVTAIPDGTAPTVAFSPANGSTGEALAVDLVLTFSEPMNRASVEGAVTVTASVAVPACGWSWASGDAVAICNFTSDLSYGITYTANVGTGAQDVAGNPLASTASASFTTSGAPDTTPPTVVSSNPASGATGAYPEANIQVTFSEAMDQSTTQGAFQIVSVSIGNVADHRSGLFTWSADGKTLTYDPPVDFANGALVTYSIGTGAQDKAPVPNYLAALNTRTLRAAYQTSVTITSSAALDGYGYATTSSTTMNNTSTLMYAGDSSANGQYKAFVAFPHTTLAPAPSRILSATFSVYQVSCVGRPYDDLDTTIIIKCIDSIFNDCDTDLKARSIAGLAALDVADFAIPYVSSGPEMTETPTANAWLNKSVLSQLVADRTAARNPSWFRLEFPVSTDNDSVSDYCSFYTSDYVTDTTLRPKLTVTFEYP